MRNQWGQLEDDPPPQPPPGIPPVPVFCPACGVEVHPDSTHCHRCGVVIARQVPKHSLPPQPGYPPPPGSPGYYEPPDSSIVTTWWVLAAIWLLVPYLGTIAWLVLVVMLIGDVSKIGCRHLRYSSLPLGYFGRMTETSWILGFFIVGIVYIPVYLATRNNMAEAVQKTLQHQLYLSEDERHTVHARERNLNFIGCGILLAIVGLVWWGVSTLD